MNRRTVSAAALFALLGMVALWALPGATAHAQVPTFRISQVFSNLDGTLQYIELTEYAGQDGQHRFTGLTLKTSSQGVEKTYVFPHDLPFEKTAGKSFIVSASERDHLPLGDYYTGNGYLCCYRSQFPDLPDRFVPTVRGTIEFAGTDRVVYEALPADGATAWYRDQSPSRGRVDALVCPPTITCPAFRRPIAQSEVHAVEYHHAGLDHYFATALSDEIDALDAGRQAGWRRTGERFVVGGGAGSVPGLDTPVCRLYIAPEAGDSHFLSAWPDECVAAQRLPRITLETMAAFHVALPDLATGECPAVAFGLFLDEYVYSVPLYRLWNGRVDSNHRYTKRLDVRADMIAKGYVSEGFGPLGVAMCVL